MKHLRLLFLLFTLSLFSPFLTSVYCQEQEGFVTSEAVLPSDQTYAKIEESSGVTKPGLRYGPGEWGNANKESPLPLAAPSLPILLVLSSILLAYRYHKKEPQKRNNI